MPAIEAHHLYKIFGRRGPDGVERLKAGATREDLKKSGQTAAVIDASFSVEEGEIFVVMGLSGSGKSTLIRMVNGLFEPTSGHVDVYGANLTAMNPHQLREARRDKISMVFQHFALLPHRTVAENAAYGLEIKGLPKAERRERAVRALELCGLKGWHDYFPGELSGGMRQRVGLARALAADTPVLLMDEAFSALDPLIRREMQDQLIELQHKLGKTILFITHDLNEAMRLGDRIAMMRNGEIVQIGTSQEILTDPANDYVAQFVADVDRTRVLTASSVMEPPVAVLGAEQGPRVAHRLMRENQQPGLYVTSRERELLGFVMEERVADDLDAQTIKPVMESADTVVQADTPIAELFTPSAENRLPLPVVDDGKRLVGVIPRVTLLAALGAGMETPTRTPDPGGPAPGDPDPGSAEEETVDAH